MCDNRIADALPRLGKRRVYFLSVQCWGCMRTRTRKTTAILPPVKYKYWRRNGAFVRETTHPNDYRVMNLTITDEPSNPRGFNACDHLKIEWDEPVCGQTPRAYHPSRGYDVAISPVAPNSLDGLWPTEKPALDWAAAMEELERNARGDMSTHVNMVVNAAEVVELKTLVRSVCSAFKALTRKWRISDPRVRRLLKGRRRKGRRASSPSLQELADGHLAYSFGVQPLMRDIGAFLEINQKIRDRRKELSERSCRSVRIAARVTATSELQTTSSHAAHPVDYPTVKAEYRAWTKGTGVVSAVCSAFYNVDNPSTRWKMVAQAMGLTSPLTSFWNLVPFSFVADWFLPIGAAIKKVERAGLNLVDETAVTKAFILSDYHYSTKYTGVTLLDTTIAESPVPSWIGIKTMTQAQRWSHYVRTGGRPPVTQWWPLQSSDWTVSRTALSTSLSIQRLNRTPKPQPKKWPTLSQIHAKALHARRRP